MWIIPREIIELTTTTSNTTTIESTSKIMSTILPRLKMNQIMDEMEELNGEIDMNSIKSTASIS